MKRKFFSVSFLPLLISSVFIAGLCAGPVEHAKPVDQKLETDAEKINRELLPLKIKQMRNPKSMSKLERDRMKELEAARASNREARRRYAFSR